MTSMQQLATADTPGIQFLPKVSEYLSLIMTLIFAFGVCFQLPVILTLLAREIRKVYRNRHGTVVGSCEKEAAVYALAQLRAATAGRQLAAV